MFEDIDKSFLTEYAPSLKRLNFEEDFKNSGYSNKLDYKKSIVKEKVNKDFSRSTVGDNSDYFNTPRKDFVGPLDERKTLKDKLKDSSLNKSFSSLISKIAGKLPNNQRDVYTASSLGVQFKDNPLSMFTDKINPEKTGYNPISKSSINIDYLSDKIDIQYRKPIKDSDWRVKSFFKNQFNSSAEYLGQRRLEQWKQMHREETAKSVRNLGDNIDPFENSDNTDYFKQKRKTEEARSFYHRQKRDFNFNLKKNGGNADSSSLDAARSTYKEELSKINNFPNKLTNKDLPDIKERSSLQLKEVEKRIEDAQNNVKRFFNPIDKEELTSLQKVQEELTERIRRIDGNYGISRISTEEIKIPKSVAESFSDLHKQRVDLYNQVFSDTGNSNLKERGPVQRSGQAFPQRALSDVNSQLAENSGFYKDHYVPNSKTLGTPKYTKDFTPSFGTSGYGLGFFNAWNASKTEHAVRAAHLSNPLGASSRQALMETFGIMNNAQRMQAAQARGFGKLGGALVPGLSVAQIGLGVYNNEDAGQIFEDLVSMGSSLAGWRVGSAVGGSLTQAGSLGRLAGLGLGGLSGMALGYGLGVATIGGVRDIMSNESKIRGFAKKAYTKESIVSQNGTTQSLTSRQASLQKLAKSGDNSRGLLLGNEAMLLATGG